MQCRRHPAPGRPAGAPRPRDSGGALHCFARLCTALLVRLGRGHDDALAQWGSGRPEFGLRADSQVLTVGTLLGEDYSDYGQDLHWRVEFCFQSGLVAKHGFSAGFGSLTMAAKGSLRPKRGIAVARRGHVPHVAHAPIARSGPEAGRGTGHGTGMFLETRAGAGSCFVEMSESLLRRIRLRSRTAASRHHDLHWQCQACFWGQMGCRRFG